MSKCENLQSPVDESISKQTIKRRLFVDVTEGNYLIIDVYGSVFFCIYFRCLSVEIYTTNEIVNEGPLNNERKQNAGMSNEM